jgi:hypothetical protein
MGVQVRTRTYRTSHPAFASCKDETLSASKGTYIKRT